MNFNYNHLYYFYVAAKSGGITIAADHLHISQPSLSSQLKVLEESFDIKLFEKVGRRNRLTPTGNVVYGYCKQMFELAEKMSGVVTKTTPSAKRKIQIGVSSEVEKEFITEVISLFFNKFPAEHRPQVNLSSAPLNQLLDHLRFKEIDTIITAQEIQDSDFVNLEKVRVPVVLCCSSKLNEFMPMNYDKVDANFEMIDELAKRSDVQWVLPSSNFELRSQIDKFFEDKKIERRIVFESDSIAALVRSVHNELGFSFLPLLHVASEIKGHHLKRFGPEEGYWNYQVTLGCHPHNQDDNLVKIFSEAFRELCAEINHKEKSEVPFLQPLQINA